MRISHKSTLHQRRHSGDFILKMPCTPRLSLLGDGTYAFSMKPHEATVTNKDVSQTSCQAFMPSSIHPLALVFFLLFVDANATARETKLSLWPPSSSSWSADTFTCSANSPLPRPLFLFQSFTKNFFSSYIFFFLPSSHLHQHHMAWRIMWSPRWLLPGRRKEKCVSELIFERSEFSPALNLATFDLPLTSAST